MKAPHSHLALALFAATLLSAADSAPGGAPIVVPNSKQYDIKSKINGQTYRIMVATPFNADPAVTYPVLYFLDGNQNFGTAAYSATTWDFYHIAAPAIVVGIGYATGDTAEVNRRRASDLTPPVYKSGTANALAGPSGGGDAFVRVIEEEVKPFVMARYKVDSARQMLYGKSLGGLLALRILFRHPTAFSTYILASPSIWWNDREVLADEESFSKKARAGEFRLKILVTSAGDEQYRGDDPKLSARAITRMVDNASELADRLAALNPGNISVVRTIFPGESHISVGPASVARAIVFALPPK